MRAAASLRASDLEQLPRSVAFADADSPGGTFPWGIIAVCLGGCVALVALYALVKWRRRQSEKDMLGNDYEYAQADSPFGSDGNGYSIQSDFTTASPGELITEWHAQLPEDVRIPVGANKKIQMISTDAYTKDWSAIFHNQPVRIRELGVDRRDREHVRAFIGEVRCISSLHHAFIVGFVGVALERPGDPWMVLEHTPSDLRQRITEYDSSGHANGFDEEKLRIAFQVASALAYLHGRSPILIHRDVKSKNVFLTELGIAKLGGFSSTRRSAHDTMTAGVGTPLWMAPEVILGERYDEKADIYSLGVVLSELDTHKLPYADADVEDKHTVALLQLVTSGQLKPRFTNEADPAVVELALQCLEFEPEMRPTAADVMYRLEQYLERSIRGTEQG